MAITTELKKAVSKWVLYVGLILIAVGLYFSFGKLKNQDKLGPVGLIMVFVGFIMSVFWLSNRKDQMCSTDDQTDQYVCVDVKK